MKKIFIFLIRCYQLLLSPVAACLGARCRFEPSCSQYAMNTVRTLPLHRAIFNSLVRIASCRASHST